MMVEVILLIITVVLFAIWIEIKGLSENEKDKD
jgi:hypothetical protein